MSDVYQSQMRVPSGPQTTLEPIRAPSPDFTPLGDALMAFGRAGLLWQATVARGRMATDEATVKSAYDVGLDQLREEAVRNPEFRGTVETFQTKKKELETRLLGGIANPLQRAEMGRYFVTHGLSVERTVKDKNIIKENDYNTSTTTQMTINTVREVAAISDPVERAAKLKALDDHLDSQVAGGWMTHTGRVQIRNNVAGVIAESDVMGMIRDNPKLAQAALQDPERLKSLDPKERQRYLNQAQAAINEQEGARQRTIGQFAPARALGNVGRVNDRGSADVVFEKGMVQIESGGNPNAVSPAGAIGLSQLMPNTARVWLRRLGMHDVANLSDPQLTEVLKRDTGLNLQLGKQEWYWLLQRYDGNIAAATAAYNAGVGNQSKPRGDAWYAEATRRFGPNFTPDQFMSVVTIPESRNHVRKMFDALGSDRGGTGMSYTGNYGAATAISAANTQSEAQYRAAVRETAEIGRQTYDPSGIMAAGYNADPAKYAVWRSEQMAAANTGDAAARAAVIKADFQRDMLPYRQQALAMAPADLERAVQIEEAALAGASDVPMWRKGRLDVWRETQKKVSEAARQNPIGLMETAGYVPEHNRVVINPQGSLGNQQEALSIRGAQANEAQRLYGGPALALKPEELAALKQRWNAAGPDEQFDILQGFGMALEGRAFTQTLGEVTGDKMMAPIIARFARERPELAREMFRGAQLLGAPEIQNKLKFVRPLLSNKLGGQVYPTPEIQEQAVRAAIWLDTARREVSKTLYDETDTSGFEQALEDVTGPLVKVNGVITPMPPSLGSRASDLIANFSETDLAFEGGAVDNRGLRFSAQTLASTGIWRPLTPGGTRYEIDMHSANPRGSPVLRPDGDPLVVDLAMLQRRHGAAATIRREEGARVPLPSVPEMGTPDMPVEERFRPSGPVAPAPTVEERLGSAAETVRGARAATEEGVAGAAGAVRGAVRGALGGVMGGVRRLYGIGEEER